MNSYYENSINKLMGINLQEYKGDKMKDHILPLIQKEIETENILHYTMSDYVNIGWYIENNLDKNCKEKAKIINIMKNKIKKYKEEFDNLQNYVIKYIDSDKISIYDGEKQIIYLPPPLERQHNWPYNILELDIVQLFGELRDSIRDKYSLILLYIEDLLVKKYIIKNNMIKLELSYKIDNITPPLALILVNQEYICRMINIDSEINNFINKVNKNILFNNKKNNIYQNWWISNKNYNPLYSKLRVENNLTCICKNSHIL